MLFLLADAYVALGDHVQGRVYLDSLSALPHNNNNIRYYMGRTYEMLGEREQALDYIRQALEDHFDPVTPDRDPWLEDLRKDPRYQALRQQYLEPT